MLKETAMKKELIAPCGLDCFYCEVHEANITEQMRTFLAQQLGIPAEQVACQGCRAAQGRRLSYTSCATLDCVTQRGLEFCFECGDFPCAKLQPAADGAARYPHNMKVYNLCRMKAVGVERWAEEEALGIRQRYFRGKFAVGLGPILE
jgi:hypothetical protein